MVNPFKWLGRVIAEGVADAQFRSDWRHIANNQWNTPMKCNDCDEGYVEKDRSYGDWMEAVRVKCDMCDDKQNRLCSYECGRPATTVDEYSDAVCEQCRATNIQGSAT
jgi:hypothetical protein